MKTGQKWDRVPVDNVSVSDLDKESFDIFRREAIRSKRMSKADLDMADEELLEKLSLLADGKLKRAAVMLFHRKPDKWVTGCYTKIGKFGKGADLLHHDEVNGSLFIQADRIVDLIYLKYLKAEISYYKETRVETYPYPRDGIREIVFNALIHSNWADSVPIQIRIEDDAMYISNSCVFPSDLAGENLFKTHRSMPYNPDIANAFYRAGYVESWGRGIQKICEECENHGNLPPEFMIDSSGIMVKITALEKSKYPKNKSIKKVAIEHEKVAIGSKEVAISDEKVAIDTLNNALDKANISSIMRNRILHLYQNILHNEAFGRTNISEINECSYANAGKLIATMMQAQVIVPIKGKGKGKYIFRLE